MALLDALRRSGGVWFGWSGEISERERRTPKLHHHSALTVATLDLTPDDIHAVTLAYPAPGFLAARGALGGRVVFPSGDPVPQAYVQTVDYSDGSAAFGPGAFTDRRGQFMLEGMRPGPIHVWVRPLIAPRAHGSLALALEAGSLDLVDRQRWFRVHAGEITLVPDLVVERGRASGK